MTLRRTMRRLAAPALLLAALIAPLACRRAEPITPGEPATPAGPGTMPRLPGATPTPPGAVPSGPVRAAFTSYPPSTDPCGTDADCTLLSELRNEPGLTGCCPGCAGFVAGTTAWATRALAACNAAGPCSSPVACPLPTRNPYSAVCEGGRCVVRRDAR